MSPSAVKNKVTQCLSYITLLRHWDNEKNQDEDKVSEVRYSPSTFKSFEVECPCRRWDFGSQKHQSYMYMHGTTGIRILSVKRGPQHGFSVSEKRRHVLLSAEAHPQKFKNEKKRRWVIEQKWATIFHEFYQDRVAQHALFYLVLLCDSQIPPTAMGPEITYEPSLLHAHIQPRLQSTSMCEFTASSINSLHMWIHMWADVNLPWSDDVTRDVRRHWLQWLVK